MNKYDKIAAVAVHRTLSERRHKRMLPRVLYAPVGLLCREMLDALRDWWAR